MNILIITQHFWPEDFRINELSLGFLERGHSVTVLTGVPNYPEGKIFPEYKKNKKKYSKLNTINIKRIPVTPRGTNKISLAINYLTFVLSGILFSPFIFRKDRFDLIFVFEPSPITVCLPGIFIKFIKKAKLCLWVLDLWPQSLYAVGYIKRDSFIISIVKKLVRFIYSKCDIILGTSKSFVKEIRKDAPRDMVIKFFPNSYEQFYDRKVCQPATELKSNSSDFNIIFAGNFGDAQDMPTILKGMNILKKERHIKLFLIGDGKKTKWIKNYIERNNLENNVILLGRYPADRMPEFFYHADCLLVSLKPHEVFDKTIPGKLQSYLISKKPILGLISGEAAEIISKIQCGIVSRPGDGKSFAESVIQLSRLDQKELERFKENGYNYAKNNFNQELLFNNLDGWLQEIVD